MNELNNDKFDYTKQQIGVLRTHQNGATLRISEQISFNVFVQDGNPQSIQVIRHKKNEQQVKFTIQEFQYIDQFVELIKSFTYDTKSKMKISFNQTVSNEAIASAITDSNIAEIIKIIQQNNVNISNIKNIIDVKIRQDSISQLEKSINNQGVKLNNKRENWFQDFFQKTENHWILGNAIDFKFIHQIESKHILPTSDGQRNNETDFISQNLFGYCSVVEIKTPETALMKKVEERTDLYIPDKELTTAISQVIHYQNRGIESSDSRDGKQYISNAGGLVIIGHSKQFDNNETMKRSFELYRNSIKNVSILTYDELLLKCKNILCETLNMKKLNNVNI
jgi:hypothetical protein